MDFLDKIYFDNTVRAYLVVIGTIIVVMLLKRILSHSVASLLHLMIRRKWTIGKQEFIKLILKPLSWLIVVTIAVFAIDRLNFPSAWEFRLYGHSSQEILDKAGISIIIITFTWFVISLIDFIALILEQKAKLTKDKSDDQIIIFFRDFLKVLIVIFGGLLIIKAAFNQNIGSLLTGLSIVGAALALAAKESLENLIASFIIFFDKPFFTGDHLKVNNVTGTVERIGLRSTRIRTVEKTLVTVPNKQMVDSVVDNMSMRSQRRAEIKLELSEKTGAPEAESLIAAVKQSLLNRQQELFKFTVFLTEFSKNGVVISIEYFTPPFTMSEFNKQKQSINLELMKILAVAKVEMASSASSVNIYNAEGDGGASKPQPII